MLPRWWHRLVVFLRSWLRPSAVDAEMAEELRFHFDRQVEAGIAAGLAPGEARRKARLLIGHDDPIREASRDGRAGALARQFGRDLRHGARLLHQAPAFCATAVAIVALGIGSVTAIFSVVHGVQLRPLPFRDPDRLVRLWTNAPAPRGPRAGVNGADHRDWLDANQVFDDIALYRQVANFNLVGGGDPERLFGGRVAANLFPLLGATAAIGRTFTEAEDETGHEQVVLLSDALWRRRFGADPSVVGRTINLSGVPYQVVGVMGADFQFPGREFQIWVPLTINPAETARKIPGYCCLAVARLKAQVGLDQARAEMAAIASRLALVYPATNAGTSIDVVPLHADLVQASAPALYTLLGAALSLLLVACLNMSTLVAARAASRSREYGVRLALGASPGRVALQAATEVMPLLALGGALGVALAAWAVAAFGPLAPPTLPRVENIEVNGSVLAFSAIMLLASGAIASVLPAAQAWRTDATVPMREDGRTLAGSRRQSRVRSLLVVAQIALALPLLAGAALLGRSLANVAHVDPGFRPDHVLSLHVAIPRSKYRDDGQVAGFSGRLVEQVSSLPGVASAGMISRLPLAGVESSGEIECDVDGRPQPIMADVRTATPGYFRTMGIGLREGRTFDERDGEVAPAVGIVDDRLARTFWPGQSAIGRRCRLAAAGSPWIDIVGVVGHVRQDGLDLDPRPQMYWNYEQRAMDRMVLVVRGEPGARGLTASVLAAVRAIDPEQPVYDVRTMDAVIDRSLSERWLNAALMAAFGAASLLICCIGVYGQIAFGVARQTREFGIRLALGASRRSISGLVMGRGLALAAAGGGLGLILALWVARGLAGMLFEVRPTDLWSFGGSAAALLAAAALASYLPARTAAAVEPMVTLRAD
jgi:putative ABC transport system permease protein